MTFEIMGIMRNDFTWFLISVLGNHRDNLGRKMYAKQPLRTNRLVEDMRGNKWEHVNELLERSDQDPQGIIKGMIKGMIKAKLKFKKFKQ